MLLVPLPLPRLTLFPYTTLFRAGRGLVEHHHLVGLFHRAQRVEDAPYRHPPAVDAAQPGGELRRAGRRAGDAGVEADRKSTRRNSSPVAMSYADFCLKKKIHSRA